MVAAGLTDAPRSRASSARRCAARGACIATARAPRDQPLPPASATAPLRESAASSCPTRWRRSRPTCSTEQHDWFEDEIGFVRAALRRGERAVDIGANHGVYAHVDRLGGSARRGGCGRSNRRAPSPSACARRGDQWAAPGRGDPGGRGRARRDRRAGHGAQTELAHLQAAGDETRGRPHGLPHGRRHGLPRSLGVRRSGGGGDARRLPRAPGPARRRLRRRSTPKAPRPPSSTAGRRFFAEESPLVMFEVKQGERWTSGWSRASKSSATTPTA